MGGKRGTSPWPAASPKGGRNSASSKASPGAIARFLYSCGYEVVGHVRKVGDWHRAEVKDRKTGAARGTRWVRPRLDRPGYVVLSTDPDPKVSHLDADRKCPTCDGPMITVRADEPVPDVCHQVVGGPALLVGHLCVTAAFEMMKG